MSRSLRFWLTGGAAGAALMMGAPGVTYAQSAPAAQSGTEVEAITVTAERRTEDIQNVPVSVQAISPREITALGIKETEDIGKITPDVTIVNPEGAGNQPLITIRGIGLNDFDTNNSGPNGVYIDDVYISSPSAQSFAIFDLNQVQILKGPQGTLYGRNTSGGAVVFTSNKPTDQFTSDLHVEYGNFNTAYVVGAVGGPITSNLDARVAVAYNHSDGYMWNELTNNPASGTNNEALRIQLLYKPTDNLKIAFSSTAGYVHNLPTEYGHIGTFVPGTQGSASPTVCSVAQAFAGQCVDLFGYGTPSSYWSGEWSRNQELQSLNLIESLRADYTLGKITLTSITSYQYNWKFFPEDTDAGPNGLLAVDYGTRSNTWTQEFRAAENEKNYNWVVGAYYLHEHLTQNQPLLLFENGDDFGGFGIPAGPGAFNGIAQQSFDNSLQVTDSAAIYGQGDYNLGKLTLTLGGRFTYEHKTFDYDGSTQYQDAGIGNYGPLQDVILANEAQSVANFTWRAALSYHFTDNIMGYATASTGFKSGDFNGSFLSNIEQQALLQLQPVKPEYVTSYEVGAKTGFFEHRLVFDVALFYNDYRDEQIFASVPQLINSAVGPIEETTQILANAHKAYTEGAEFEIKATPIRGLNIDLQPAWLQAKIDQAGLPLFAGSTDLDGKQLANAPHFTFVGTVEYRMSLPNLDDIDFRWNSDYRSHEFFDSTNDPYIQQNAYWLHNLNIDYESRKGWSAGIYIRNLTNTEYAVTSTDLTSPFGLLEPVLGMPRTFGVELNYHY
jgi:iron complex outermembrane recepter protein